MPFRQTNISHLLTPSHRDQVQQHPNCHGGHLHARKGEDKVVLPPDLPDSYRTMLASISMLSISSVATAHIFIADFWTFHLSSNKYILSLSLPAANWDEWKLNISKVSLSLFWNNSYVFSWARTSTPEGTRYLNFRPGVSLLGLQVSIMLASNGCQIYTLSLVSFQ